MFTFVIAIGYCNRVLGFFPSTTLSTDFSMHAKHDMDAVCAYIFALMGLLLSLCILLSVFQ